MSSKTNATATKEEATPALVPKLRFPEFRDAEGWKEKSLVEICHRITNGKANAQDHEEAGIYPLFDRSAVIKRSNEFMFDGEAVILPGEGMRFVPKFYRGKFNLHQRAYALMDHQGDARFVYHSLDYLQDSLAKRAVKSTVLSLRLPIVENFVIGYPKPAEQQKLAECLSSVDELVTAQARKLDALKTHKKGLMQQLFPREGETQPRLRFPEFRDAGEWEERLLGDVVKSVKTGKLDANAMVENGQYRFYTCAKNHYQIDNYAFEGEALLIAGNGAHLGYIHHYIGRFNAYQRTYVLQNFETNVVFLRCVLERYLPSRILLEKKDGNTPYIVLSTITEMPLLIPQNQEEQQCIADCLSSLDELIAAQTQKLDALKTHKKGLMQQLFPTPGEAEA